MDSARQKTTPQQARSILTSTPQIAYALVALMVKMNAIDVQVLQVRPFMDQVPSHDIWRHRSPGLGSTSRMPNGLVRRKRSLRTLRTYHRQLSHLRNHPLSSHRLLPYLHIFRNIVHLLRKLIRPPTLMDTVTHLSHQIKHHTWHKGRVNTLVPADLERRLPRSRR